MALSDISLAPISQIYGNAAQNHTGGDVPRILVVDDDIPLTSLLRRRLEAEEYKVDTAHDGEIALQALAQTEYHLVTLDLNLPKIDGFCLIRQLRSGHAQLPVLVLTGRPKLEDKVLSLDAGADDCITKPFSFIELAARVRALLRRNPYAPTAVLRVGDLTLDRQSRRVERSGRIIELGKREFELLEHMMRNARRAMTRESIMEAVWNAPLDRKNNIVDVYVSYLRNKVDAGYPRKMIRTVRKVGYMLSDKD